MLTKRPRAITKIALKWVNKMEQLEQLVGVPKAKKEKK